MLGEVLLDSDALLDADVDFDSLAEGLKLLDSEAEADACVKVTTNLGIFEPLSAARYVNPPSCPELQEPPKLLFISQLISLANGLTAVLEIAARPVALKTISL